MRIVLSMLAAAPLMACTTAGPFVTSIADAGNGMLMVEKCEVQFDAWLGIVQTGDCDTHRIKVSPPAHYHPENQRR